MQKLFLSFSSLLREILEGNVTEADLKKGFFMFGCTRGHAYDPGGQGETDERKWNQGRNALAYPALLEALKQAESDGRAGWIRIEPRATRDHFEVLSEMLVKHGLPALGRTLRDGPEYSYPAMRDRIVEAGLPLEVIY